MQELEARILICDPNSKLGILQLIRRRFSSGSEISLEEITDSNDIRREILGNAEITYIPDRDILVKDVLSRNAPYYSLLIIHSDVAKKEGIANRIARIKEHDSNLSVMIAGQDISPGLAGKCSRNGANFFAENEEEFLDQTRKIFQRYAPMPNAVVFKIGGSAFDYDRIVDGRNMETVCNTLVEIFRKKVKVKKEYHTNRVIILPGAGQFGDVSKDWKRKHEEVDRVAIKYPQAIDRNLQMNIEQLSTLFGDTASMLSSGEFFYVTKYNTRHKIVLIPTAPPWIMARDNIPLSDSDTQTIALAEYLGIERIVLVKRTDGIYTFDPYRGYPLGVQFSNSILSQAVRNLMKARWIVKQMGNQRYEQLTIDEAISGRISTDGTGMFGFPDGTTGHLMEKSALEYMKNCKHVKEILVVHIAPEEMFIKSGRRTYRHIITGEKVTLDSSGWDGYLRASIMAAYQGEAKSKIVRE